MLQTYDSISGIRRATQLQHMDVATGQALPLLRGPVFASVMLACFVSAVVLLEPEAQHFMQLAHFAFAAIPMCIAPSLKQQVAVCRLRLLYPTCSVLMAMPFEFKLRSMLLLHERAWSPVS